MEPPLIETHQVITKLPQPFHFLSSINENDQDFDSKVHETCSNKNHNNDNTAPIKVAKTILLGNPSVGKTSLMNRFARRKFFDEYVATIGIDLVCKDFSVLDTPFQLQIWDTAGQERFRSTTFQYHRGTNVLVIVFDMTELETLHSVRDWVNAANDKRDEPDPPLIFLVGSKRDLLTTTRYREVEGESIKIAAELNAEFWCVSAKTGENVDSLFGRLTALSFQKEVLKRSNKKYLESQPRTRGFSLTDQKIVCEKGCCK